MSKPSSILIASLLVAACTPTPIQPEPVASIPSDAPPSSTALTTSADPGAPASPSTCVAQRVDAPVKTTFGGKFPGFATWLSDSGRLAVLYQFKTDDDRDGKI